MGHALLHSALQELVHGRVARKGALSVARCHAALDCLGEQVRGLHECLLRQRAPLLRIRDELRAGVF